jgi:two-component system response regulator AlgR
MSMSPSSEPLLRVVIVDDEAPARSRLRDLLVDCAAKVPLEVIGEASTGREALELLQGQDADLVLLDIRMPEMDGAELAAHLLKLPDPPAVIFITAYDEYAVKAFELNAIDYLLKPIRATRLAEALAKARAIAPLRADLLRGLSDAPRHHLSVTEGGKVYLVPIADILYFKAELKYVTIRTAQREYLIEESLTRLEQEYAKRFVRIHRNCLVSRDAITGFERLSSAEADAHWVVVLRGLAEKLAVSRRQQHIVRDLAR